MTYQMESEVFAPYGHIQNRQTKLRKELKSLIKNKTHGGAWMVSHCSTHSKREVLVKELEKYIPVDSYGACGNLSCQKDGADINPSDPELCGNLFEDNHRFYFAFENSLCTDYVTEKLFWRCQRYVVPVVLERENYKHLCPKYGKPWFIAADDFKPVDEIGLYLKYLMKNDMDYYEYLSWHEHYKMVSRVTSDTQEVSDDHWCELCMVVGKGLKKEAWAVYNWWQNGTCHGDGEF